METKFKIGDKVRCTKILNVRQDYIRVGGIYSVCYVGKDTVKLENTNSIDWTDTQFELIKQKESQNNIQMKYFKTKEILSRSITVCVTVDGSNVNTGYAVRRMDDEPNVELAKRISLGRANNTKTNLTTGLTITDSLTEKYILAAIANKVLADIENGTIVIKGIR